MSQTLDCLLIYPPFAFTDGFNFGQRALDVPLGVITLAAYVRECNYSVELIDCNLEFEDTDAEFEAFFKKNYVEKYAAIKVIGITTTTPTINASFRIAKLCKKYYPDCIMALGGAHASFVPDESLDKEYIDCVAMGEGEDTLKELIEGFPFGDIDGLAYRVQSEEGITFVRNKPRTRIKKLDELPRPAYDMIDIPKYRPIIGNFKRLPAMMVITSRGCPWSCNFCRRTVGKMWTYRSAESLYAELKFLAETYGVKDIAFMDDVFTVNKQRVIDLCNMLLEKPLDIQWQCFARVDIVDPDMLKLMKKAGCWGVMYGVENFDQSILDGLKKEIEISQIFQAVQWAKDAKLEIRACMMVGNDGDTEEILNRNIDLVIKLDPDLLSVAILTPNPGNDVFNKALREDRLMTYDWDMYYGATPIVKIDHLSPDDVVRMYRKMSFKFYLRPGYIIKRLRNIKSADELKHNIIGGIGMVTFYLEKVFGKRKKAIKVTAESELTDMQKDKLARKVDKSALVKLTMTATKQTAIT